jgi:hypothetical protein
MGVIASNARRFLTPEELERIKTLPTFQRKLEYFKAHKEGVKNKKLRTLTEIARPEKPKPYRVMFGIRVYNPDTTKKQLEYLRVRRRALKSTDKKHKDERDNLDFQIRLAIHGPERLLKMRDRKVPKPPIKCFCGKCKTCRIRAERGVLRKANLERLEEILSNNLNYYTQDQLKKELEAESELPSSFLDHLAETIARATR